MAQQQSQLPHDLTLEARRRLRVTGVTEVISFDDSSVVLVTSLGTLVILGKELQLKTLTLEGGSVAVEGEISDLRYEEPRRNGNWLRRLMQ